MRNLRPLSRNRNHLITILGFGLLAPLANAQPVLYVDADADAGGVNDGSSWCDAYINVQDALAAAAGGAVSEIRVAAGTYTPDQGAEETPLDREATFHLVSDLSVQGGYAGCGEPDPDQRDIYGYATIFSGDLNDDDVVYCDFDSPDCDSYGGVCDCGICIAPRDEENSYHVVTGNDTDSSARLDGVIILAGNANGSSSADHNRGGGLLVRDGSPTVSDCTFYANWAEDYGGGMYTIGSCSPTVTNCTFMGNAAGDLGGGMSNYTNSSPVVSDCIFVWNYADHGGGMYNWLSDLQVTDCVFLTNLALRNGGGMYNGSGRTPELTRCIFRDNVAYDEGGGMYGDFNSEPTLTDCTFAYNWADYGAGTYHSSWSRGTLTNCRFIDNTAFEDGGAMYVTDSAPTVTNGLLRGNWAGRFGGAVRNDSGGDPTLTNCTFRDNIAFEAGGGVHSSSSCPTLTNCIFWQNSDPGGEDESAQIHGSTPVIDYCCVQGWTGSWSGTGNHENDPNLVPGPGGPFYLSQTAAGQLGDSPCVDAGSASAADLGLDPLTTRTDQVTDAGTVDVGYHYPVGILTADLADLADFQNCFTGNDPDILSVRCRAFDSDLDADVELDDYPALHWAFTDP